MFVKKRIDTLYGLIIRGVGRLGVYFRNNIFISKWMGLYPGGGLKTGGGFNMGFYSMLSLQSNKYKFFRLISLHFLTELVMREFDKISKHFPFGDHFY